MVMATASSARHQQHHHGHSNFHIYLRRLPLLLAGIGGLIHLLFLSRLDSFYYLTSHLPSSTNLIHSEDDFNSPVKSKLKQTGVEKKVRHVFSKQPPHDNTISTEIDFPNDPQFAKFLQRLKRFSISNAHSHSRQHAILVPYRNREFHLQEFTKYMQVYLAKQFPDDQFSLWIVEQDDDLLFNRAWLANVGLDMISKMAPTTSCVILHDVDLVPNSTATQVPYNKCFYPMQLGSELEHFNWSYPYPTYAGGITMASLRHWQQVNGLSNDYVGWGGEDDDLYHRLRLNGLLLDRKRHNNMVYTPVLRRPPKGHGAFRTISQDAEHHVQVKNHGGIESNALVLLEEMWEDSPRWKFDGLNDVYYSLTNYTVANTMNRGFHAIHHVKAIAQKPHVQLSRQRPQQTSQHDYNKNDTLANMALEFVPIPFQPLNNAITMAGAQVGVTWGACHYLDSTDSMALQLHCPLRNHKPTLQFHNVTYQQITQQPLWLLLPHKLSNSELEGTKKFALVEHPYSRMISIYRQIFGHQRNMAGKALTEDYLKEREDPVKLNAIVQQLLQSGHLPNSFDGATSVPSQLEYAETRRQVTTTSAETGQKHVKTKKSRHVHHILRVEKLQSDLQKLTDRYVYLKDMDIDTILEAHNALRSAPAEFDVSMLKVKDFESTTMKLVNQLYAEEFKKFGYKQKQIEGDIQPTTLPKFGQPNNNHAGTESLSSFELSDIPFNGGDLLTRAAAQAGIVWGACHFASFEHLDCPSTTSGDWSTGPSYQAASLQQAQQPWLLPWGQLSRIPAFGNKSQTKVFGVVRNPYDRAISFYRQVYDQLHGFPNGIDTHDESMANYLEERESADKLNHFLKAYFNRACRPYRPDGVELTSQYDAAKDVQYVIRYEDMVRELQHHLAPLFRPVADVIQNLQKLQQQNREQSATSTVRGLDVSDLNNAVIHMVNGYFPQEFDLWYAGQRKNVTLDASESKTVVECWKSVQHVPAETQPKKRPRRMSLVRLRRALKKVATKKVATWKT